MKRFMIQTAVVLTILTSVALADDFDLTWHTIDGGGGTSAGGAFTLSGTIGQCDAQTPPIMAGGSFELTGGFWAGATIACTCPGDMNGDGSRNGRDIQQFSTCVIAGGACNCANVDGVPGTNMGDVAAFITDVLAGGSCP